MVSALWFALVKGKAMASPIWLKVNPLYNR